MRTRAVALVSALMLMSGLALDATAKQGGSPNNQADIDGTFSTDCTDFHGESDKDISYVEWWYLGDDQDEPGQKDERINAPEYDIEGEQPLAKVRVKSARSVEDFHCAGPEGPPGDETCSDGYDNDGDGLIDGADPDCQTPPAPECSDGIDNNDPEDTDADTNDPGCHTDGDPGNPATYDPDDDDETDEPTAGGTFTCRASLARVEFASGDVVEPFVANGDEDDAECATDQSAVVEETTLGGAPGQPGSLTITVAEAKTVADPGTASATVASVVVRDATGATVLEATVLRSDASVACVDGAPAFTSSSTVASLFVLGEPVDVDDHGETALGPNGELGTLHVNEELTEDTVDGQQRIQRAVWLEGSPIGSVIIAEAIADYHGDPC